MENVKNYPETAIALGFPAKINVFPGTNPNATREQVDKEIARAIQSIRDGDYEEVDLDQEK
jgi:hypothetical protein